MALSPDLQKIFPLTFSLLTSEQRKELVTEFQTDWGFENLHFFPMLVRQKKFALDIIETADYEFLKLSLETQDFPRALASAHVALDPSVQFVLIQSAAARLRKTRGVYLLWKFKGQVYEKILSEAEALLIDRLREDQVVYETDLDESEKEIVSHFRSVGVIKPSL